MNVWKDDIVRQMSLVSEIFISNLLPTSIIGTYIYVIMLLLICNHTSLVLSKTLRKCVRWPFSEQQNIFVIAYSLPQCLDNLFLGAFLLLNL